MQQIYSGNSKQNNPPIVVGETGHEQGRRNQNRVKWSRRKLLKIEALEVTEIPVERESISASADQINSHPPCEANHSRWCRLRFQLAHGDFVLAGAMRKARRR